MEQKQLGPQDADENYGHRTDQQRESTPETVAGVLFQADKASRRSRPAQALGKVAGDVV